MVDQGATVGCLILFAALATSCSTSGSEGGSTLGTSDLSSTWDLIVTGKQSTATIEISPQKVSVVGGHELQVLQTASGFDGAYDSTAIQVRGAGEPLGLGALPLPLAGQWRFEQTPSDGESCSYTLADETFEGSCSAGVSLTSDLPDLAGAQVSASRLRVLSSMFGKLGGAWSITTGEGASCTLTLEGAKIDLECLNATRFTGSVSVTFGENSLSGVTSDGIEFSAQRR